MITKYNLSFFHKKNRANFSSAHPLLKQSWDAITPVTSAEFKQKEFIAQILQDVKKFCEETGENSDEVFLKRIGQSYQNHRRSSKTKLSEIDGGLCAGLTHVWFEYLFKPANLIDIIKKGIHESILLRIIELHIAFGEVHKQFSANMLKSSYQSCEKKLYDINSKKDPNFLNQHFEFSKKWDDVGHLNTMSYLYPENEFEDDDCKIEYKESGHMVGWVKQQDQTNTDNENTRYILFDANSGEHIFKSQQHLINYLNHLLLNKRTGDGNTTVEKCYGLSFECFVPQPKPSDVSVNKNDMNVKPVLNP